MFCFLLLSQNLFAVDRDDSKFELDLNVNYDFSELGLKEEDFKYKFIYHQVSDDDISTYYFYTDNPLTYVGNNKSGQFKVNGRFVVLRKQRHLSSSSPLPTYVYINGLDNIEIKTIPLNYYLDHVRFKYYSNYDIRYDNGDLALENKEGDDAIGDPNSRLKLTYEYNDINTACKVNATLEGGEFTDRIYYSNYMPGVNGALASKKAFPRERFNFNGKSIFIFSGGR